MIFRHPGATHQHQTGDTQRLQAQQVTLQGDTVAVPASHYRHRIDAMIDQDSRSRQGGHLHPGVRVVRHLDSVYKIAQHIGLAPDVIRS